MKIIKEKIMIRIVVTFELSTPPFIKYREVPLNVEKFVAEIESCRKMKRVKKLKYYTYVCIVAI